MFPANLIAAAQNKLPNYWVANVPKLDDATGWQSFLADIEENREVIFALFNPGGFKRIHELLPVTEWIFVVFPRIEMATFVGSYLNTVQYPSLRGYWVVDWP